MDRISVTSIATLILLLLISPIYSCRNSEEETPPPDNHISAAPPAAPSNLTAVVTSSNAVALSWTASSSTNTLSGYKVYRDGGYLKTAATTSASDTGLALAVQYCYTVSAIDENNLESAQSNTGCAMTSDMAPPSVPADLIANAITSSRVDLAWSAASDDVGVTGYKLYRNGVYLMSSVTTTASDAELSPATRYCYAITAFDAAANESALSSEVCTTTTKCNAEAELLTLEATGALLAPPNVCDRVDAELKAIRAAYPATVNIRAWPSWSWQTLIIGFDVTGSNAVKAGTYTAWDALNKTYGVTVIDTSHIDPLGVVQLTFTGQYLYNIPLLSGEYANLPNVRYATPNFLIGDGSDVCLSINGDNHFFIFDAASGVDCLAGCSQHTYWGYNVAIDGSITALGTWEFGPWYVQPALMIGSPTCGAWL